MINKKKKNTLAKNFNERLLSGIASSQSYVDPYNDSFEHHDKTNDLKGKTTLTITDFNARDRTGKRTVKVPEHLHGNVKKLIAHVDVIVKTLAKRRKVPLNQIKVTLISGYRSPEHNARVGGAKKSQHLLGKAVDLRFAIVGDKTPRHELLLEVREIIFDLIKTKKITKGGVGIYRSFIHYDIRGRNARWTGK